MPGFLKFIFLIIVLNLACAGSSALRSQDPHDPIAFPVTFQFIHKAGSDPIEFDTIRYTNSFGNKYSVATLKYFISDITVQQSNGDVTVLKEALYIDAATGKTSGIMTLGKLPAGTYTFISFLFGLDKATNVNGRFPNPPENRMEWPETMGGGYHYMKLEGKFESAGEIRNFQAHLGQLSGTPHFFRVAFKDTFIKIENKGVVIQIIMDVNKWWDGPNVIDLDNITSIMDNETIQSQLMANGAGVFSIGSVR